MRITVGIQAAGDELLLRVTVPRVPEVRLAPELPPVHAEYWRRVTWLRDDLLAAADAVVEDADAAGMAQAAGCCDTDSDQEQRVQLDRLRDYGKLLFDAAFGFDAALGTEIWRLILDIVPKDPADYLEVAVLGSADDELRALQALRWEALHDGERFIAAEGAKDAAGRSVEVGVVRVITSLGASPAGASPGHRAAEGASLQEKARIPRVLFAVGSHLTDRNVRSGAEFMGIMRSLDRNGGFIQPHVLERATRQELVAELKAFQPEVLHLIGHGRRLSDGQARVQLQGDSGGERYVSAEELLAVFAEAGHWPVMMVLSACQTGAADESRISGSFAARLVAGSSVSRGVPVVVAMAGDISDTACRLFARAMTTAIGGGVTLSKAVIWGRRAAFYAGPAPDAKHPAPDSGHWVMPVLFMADFVHDSTPLPQRDSVLAVQKRVMHLNLTRHPVFFGRAPFLTALGRLLDAGDTLNVLVAHTPDSKNYGGERLLRELGALAVRSGVLPVVLAPLDQDPPTSLAGLAAEFAWRIDEIRANDLDLDLRPSEAVTAARDGKRGLELAMAMRRDLKALVEALPADDPVRLRGAGQPQTMLLCHRVDAWAAEVVDHLLLHLIGPQGLKGGTTPVPVVLTGAREARRAEPWIRYEPLDRFHADEDVLAYQWWLLNPQEALDGRQLAFAPRRGAPDDWKKPIRTILSRLNSVYDDVIYELAADMSPQYLVSANDDYLLESYAKVLP